MNARSVRVRICETRKKSTHLYKLTLDVEEDGLALDDVGVCGDAVADPAAVVAARRLLDALQHEHAGVVNGGQHQAGARVRVPVLLQNFALKERGHECYEWKSRLFYDVHVL